MLQTLLLPMTYGLLLFLCGMKIMEKALGRWAGPLLSRWLGHATASPLRGLIFSSALTAILQSSTAVTVITIGMVNAGLLSYARSLGIILGSNIGTCLTTELISLQIGELAVPLLIISITLWSAAIIYQEFYQAALPRISRYIKSLQYLSVALLGFSLILLGIRVMQSIGPALQKLGLFNWFIEQAAHNVLWGVAAGICLTALMHSSAAVIGLAMGLAGSGALPIEIGMAIVLGSNVGTCVTALLASVGGSRGGRFVAWSHIVLNVSGALLFLPFISQLQALSELLSPHYSTQIAHAQTIFNVVCSLLALPLCYLPIWRRGEQKSI